MKLKFSLVFLVLIFLFTCNNKPLKKNKILSKRSDDSSIVVNKKFKYGDSRRYGIFPDSILSNNQVLFQKLINFSSKNKINLFFKEGFYNLNINLLSIKNINIDFDKSIFQSVRISNEKGVKSSDIRLKGNLTLIESFSVFNAKNILIDTLIIKNNILKNRYNQKNRGCHIYKGTENLQIQYLQIDNLGSGSELYFKNTHAALSIDGVSNFPEHIYIKKMHIISSDRHGAYITGVNNTFDEIIIEKYAQGKTKNMSPMEGALVGKEKLLSGLWINKCNNCTFGKIFIFTKHSKGFPLKLGEGIFTKPSIIEYLAFDKAYKDTIVIDEFNTNVLVKKFEIINN